MQAPRRLASVPRAVWLLPALFASLGGCTRAEQRSGDPAQASLTTAQKLDAFPSHADPRASTRATSSATQGPSMAGRCIAALSAQPPPEAHPAARCPADDLSTPPKLALGQVVMVDAPGQPPVDVELAIEPAHQTRGLMYRRKLAPDGGMLFWGQHERVRRFWMHNTCIPLDMLFIASDLTIVGVLEQVPPLNDELRSVPCASAHVLEVNAGWTRAHGVRPGQQVRVER
jgi:uncharacterized membrane protein (UPF0127 family)